MGNVLPGNNRINAALDRVIRHYTSFPPSADTTIHPQPVSEMPPLPKPMTKTHHSSFHKTRMRVHDM